MKLITIIGFAIGVLLLSSCAASKNIEQQQYTDYSF